MEPLIPSTPEHMLWAAVLRQALEDSTSGLSSDKASAERWLFDDARHGMGSFRWVCDLFDCDPEETRAMGILNFGLRTGRGAAH